MKRAIAAIALTAVAAAPALADVRERTFADASAFSKCLNLSSMDCAVKLRDSGHPFGVAVKSAGGYTIDKVWLRVTKSNGSGSKDISVLKQNVTAGALGLLQFHEEDAAGALGYSTSALRSNGFKIRPKIEALGAGSGRQDKCPAITMTYDTSKSAWYSQRGSGSKTKVDTSFTLLFKSGGSVNNAKCGYDSAQNDS